VAGCRSARNTPAPWQQASLLPLLPLMGASSVLALTADLGSVLLVRPYKDGDADVCSVWLCSCNDAIANVVMVVALGGAGAPRHGLTSHWRRLWPGFS
jgi:hypothetical protein